MKMLQLTYNSYHLMFFNYGDPHQWTYLENLKTKTLIGKGTSVLTFPGFSGLALSYIAFGPRPALPERASKPFLTQYIMTSIHMHNMFLTCFYKASFSHQLRMRDFYFKKKIEIMFV